MTPAASMLESACAVLRRDFDFAFTQPPRDVAPEHQDFLTLRVAGDPYAVRLGDIARLVSKRTVTRAPAGAPDFIGLSGIEGAIVPVFSLGMILGYGVVDPPGWMLLCGAEDSIALGFSTFEGFWRSPLASIHADDNLRRRTREVVVTDAGNRSVIDVPLLVATIRNRSNHQSPRREE